MQGQNFRWGPLQSLACQPHVTDIVVTSDGRVWADSGQGMQERYVDSGLSSPQVMRDFAVRLCAQLGRRLDDSCPIADASTSEGIRIHAVIAPIVKQGAALSIRLPDVFRSNLPDLRAGRAFPPEWEELLRSLVQAKATFLVSGGTGTGKTTMVKALLMECPQSERLVTVEEIRELGSLEGLNCESLVVREPNIEGAGQINLTDLVKATVRMRPDRIVLGECRGEEIADLLRAFNSGHRGGMVTIHADSVQRLPARLSALGLLAGIQPQATALMAQGAFDCLVHMDRLRGRRYISQIGHFEVDKEGILRGRVMAVWDGSGPARYSPQWDQWIQHIGVKKEKYSSTRIGLDRSGDVTALLPQVRKAAV